MGLHYRGEQGNLSTVSLIPVTFCLYIEYHVPKNDRHYSILGMHLICNALLSPSREAYSIDDVTIVAFQSTLVQCRGTLGRTTDEKEGIYLITTTGL